MVYILVVGTTVCIINIVGLYPRSIYVIGLKWFLYRSCAEGLAVFFLHNGVGYKAVSNSLTFGLLWGLCSAVVPLIIYAEFDDTAFAVVLLALSSFLLVFYLCAWFLPQKYLHRRPALIDYSKFYVGALISFILIMLLILFDFHPGSCAVEIVLAVLDLIQPFVIFRALIADSRFWQGYSCTF